MVGQRLTPPAAAGSRERICIKSVLDDGLFTGSLIGDPLWKLAVHSTVGDS